MVAALLSVAVGIGWYLWQSQVRGCGTRNLVGEYTFPVKTALLFLLPPVPIVTAILAWRERRPGRAVVGLSVIATLMAGAAIAIAEIAFLSDRHCFG
jgi:hypothetical protein